MGERVYGSKYEANLDVAEIAKRVRADIKAAVAVCSTTARRAGELPDGALPPGKYSVRIDRYSMGCSVDVRFSWDGEEKLFSAKRLAFEVESPNAYPGNSADPEVRELYSPYAREVTRRLEAILAAYNHNGSDMMTDHYDVKFAARVDYDHDWERSKRAAEVAALYEPEPARMPEGDADAVVAVLLAEDVEREASAQERFLTAMGVEP